VEIVEAAQIDQEPRDSHNDNKEDDGQDRHCALIASREQYNVLKQPSCDFHDPHPDIKYYFPMVTPYTSHISTIFLFSTNTESGMIVVTKASCGF
jgi:hypothetical protein